MVKILHYLLNYDIFLIMGNAGFISSTVGEVGLKASKDSCLQAFGPFSKLGSAIFGSPEYYGTLLKRTPNWIRELPKFRPI